MKNIENDLSVKARLYENLGVITQTMSGPVRLKIIQNLCNRPYTVEDLSLTVNETIGNTSQHLQKLLKAGMVNVEKDGVSRIYKLSSHKVVDAWIAIQLLAEDLDPQIQMDQNKFCPPELCTPHDIGQVAKQIKSNKAVLIDAREKSETDNTPVSQAHNVTDNKFLNSLMKTKIIYVFCRGRYCSRANNVVLDLRKKGYKAFRLKENSYQINSEIDKIQ